MQWLTLDQGLARCARCGASRHVRVEADSQQAAADFAEIHRSCQPNFGGQPAGSLTVRQKVAIDIYLGLLQERPDHTRAGLVRQAIEDAEVICAALAEGAS